MLFPKKLKYKKMQKRIAFGIETSVNNPSAGFYGIKSTISGRISAQQIESLKKLILKKVQKYGKIILRIFPFLSITSKPVETRMGKGKGSFDYWCFPVKSGRLIVEFQGISYIIASSINKLVNSKLCFKTRLIKNL